MPSQARGDAATMAGTCCAASHATTGASTGSEMTSAQLMVSSPPSSRASLPPSA